MQVIETREDGRNFNEMRPLACEQGILNRTDGSARFSQGKTSVMVGINGPGQAKLVHDEKADCASINVNFKRETSNITAFDKEFAALLRKTFEQIIILDKYPRALIDITVQVFEDQGSLLATSVNAINLALIDSGIALNSFVTGVSCAIKSSGQLYMDPSNFEEEDASCLITIVSGSAQDGIISSTTSGVFSSEQYLGCAEAARRGGEVIRSFVRISQERKYQTST